MPELPEVETTVRDLKKKIIGKKIKSVWTDWPKTLRNINAKILERKMKGKSFSGAKRRGKNILLEINGKTTLWIHLKMTGHLLFRPTSLPQKGFFSEKVNGYVHFRIVFSDGKELALSDLRKFAKVIYLEEPISKNLLKKHFSDLGIEPLTKEFSLKRLYQFVKEKRFKNKELKVFLMDQSIVVGIGNIYASEILFDSKLNPKRKIGKLQKNEVKKLYESIKKILLLAVKKRGTSISDFRDADGKKGGYGEIRQVYQMKGKPCPKCKTPIESFKQAQRSTFWCPKCQK